MTRLTTAWAVLDPHGQVSELHMYRTFAVAAIVNRGDRQGCLLQEVEVVARGPRQSAEPTKKKR